MVRFSIEFKSLYSLSENLHFRTKLILADVSVRNGFVSFSEVKEKFGTNDRKRQETGTVFIALFYILTTAPLFVFHHISHINIPEVVVHGYGYLHSIIANFILFLSYIYIINTNISYF